MRIVRFVVEDKIRYGILRGNTVMGLRGDPFKSFKGPGSPFKVDGSTFKHSAVKLLVPCLPSKVVCVGGNYRRHLADRDMPIPAVPIIFIKPSTAVIGTDDKIVLKHPENRVDYEGEFGVVIGKKATDVTVEKAKEYVLGYTCCNDVSDRNASMEDKQPARSKGYDTFAPIGPWIETEVDPDDLQVETYLNDELRQSDRTSGLIFNVSELISFISGVMTLLPGDVISTGTMSGIGQMKPGDKVEVKIEKIGTLRNFVVAQI